MPAVFKRRRTYLYLAAGSIILAVSSTFVTPPDDVTDIIFGFAGSILFILAFTHTWDKVRHYVILSVFSVGLFIFSLLFHNIVELVGKGTIMEDIRVILFLFAVFMSPAGIVIGITGSIFKSAKAENE